MVRLRWGADLHITAAEGDARALTGRAAEELMGRPLGESLGISARDAESLNTPGSSFLARLRDNRHEYFRATVTGPGEGYFVDLDTVLQGAPPIQISALSSSLSHELRNPLSSVKMAVQTLARNTDLSDRDRRRLTIANREIRTLERMLWVLSEYGRDTLPDSLEMTLKALVQDAAAMIEPELTERSVHLVIREEQEGIRVVVDAQRLRPVLSQLLLNVAMGLEAGSPLQLVLKPGSPSGGVLEVYDPAAALPPEEAGSLFEPFGSRLARGAGLSLAALRRVVRAAGGDVAAHGGSQPGTVLTVTLPG